MKFSDIKSETLNLRVSLTFKKALKEAAENEQRSMVNMLEVLLGEYCGRNGIELSELNAYSPDSKQKNVNQKSSAGGAT